MELNKINLDSFKAIREPIMVPSLKKPNFCIESLYQSTMFLGEWISNTPYEHLTPEKQSNLIIGPPKETKYFTVKELEDNFIIGLYTCLLEDIKLNINLKINSS